MNSSKIQPNKNYSGVLIGQQKTDWLLGANSPLGLKVRLEDKNWKSYTSQHEIQVYNIGKSDTYDTSLCTQYASTDVIEHILNYELLNNKVPVAVKQFLEKEGYLVNGRLEISERLGGANSEMTNSGTYLYKAANAIRNFGIVPQSKLPLASNFKENINPELISKDIYDLGEKSKEYITINWNWVAPQDVSEALKDSPLLATVRYADGDGILKPTGSHQHAIAVVGEESDYYVIDDSYWRQYKKYDKGYDSQSISWIEKKRYVDNFLQFTITYNINNMNVVEFIGENDKNQIRNINTGAYGVVYSGKLLEIKAERAGLYMIDREARGLIGKKKTVSVNNKEWEQIREAGYMTDF